MTSESKPGNTVAANQQVHSALNLLSEPELIRLLKSVKALRKDLRLIPSADSRLVQAVGTTQNLLKIWHDEIVRSLTAKQAKDTFAQLRDWDNEGGAVRHASQLRQ